ncbi:hypothetical protein AAEU32_15350 [Pseudoalteromonas sp. SSDWG2]|uniref:hypothetical protein n=1 Tax=Pseudoalteromonas sp. SSDWG2 TaxID=3139391 RepID=UPI003BABF299
MKNMDLFLHAHSSLMVVAILFAFTVIPVKIGAMIFDAFHQQWRQCAIAAFLAMIASLIVLFALGGSKVGILTLFGAYLVVSYVYSKVLGLDFSWSLIFTVFVHALQIGVFQGLAALGLLG